MMQYKKNILPFGYAGLYLLLVNRSMGLRAEHLLLTGFVLVCYYLHTKSRQFALDFLPFAFFGAMYDFLRIYPKNWAGPIHIDWPYHLEKMFFGFNYHGRVITPNEFFLTHHYALLDVVTGLAYSLHMVVPIGFAFISWLRHPLESRRFIQAFLLVNFFAFITYIAFPVAPPWYVELYGFAPASWSLPSNAAGLSHFDELFGVTYFHDIYAKNAWVFGAIPSMHSAFPLLVILFARRFMTKGLIPLYIYMFLIWFSAVYLCHHYIIDLASGVLYVLVAFFLIKALTKPQQKPVVSL